MNVAETSKWAVIDTAFTKTVAGGNWFENYISNLPDVSQVQTKASLTNSLFKSVDGRKVKSIKGVIFPVIIVHAKCKIRIVIFKENIPVLLSNGSLKEALTVIDLSYDKAIIFVQANWSPLVKWWPLPCWYLPIKR